MAKLSVSQAWDETRAVLAHDGKLIGAVALALIVLPGLVLSVFMPTTNPGKLPPPGPWMIVALVAVLVSLAGQIAIIRMAVGPHVSVGEAIAHGARRLPACAGAFLLWTVPLFLLGGALFAAVGPDPQHPSPVAVFGLLAVSILGFFLFVRLILTLPVGSTEPSGPIAILRRAWDLSRGNWWRLFLFLFAFLFTTLVVLMVAEMVVGTIARLALGSVDPLSVGGLLVAIVGQLVSACLLVVMYVMLARMYLQRAGRDQVEVSVPSSGT